MTYNMSERDHGQLTWIRLHLPNEVHSALKLRAKTNNTGINLEAIETLRHSTNLEQGILPQLIKLLDPTSQNHQITKQGELLQLTWESSGQKRHVVYDTKANELLHDLPQCLHDH